jgi:phosphocarrier protein
MVEREVTVTNALGLHARAAARFVQTSNTYICEIRVGNGHREVNGKSLLGVLTLAAAMGTRLQIITEGLDEEEAADALTGLVERGFEEEG